MSKSEKILLWISFLFLTIIFGGTLQTYFSVEDENEKGSNLSEEDHKGNEKGNTTFPQERKVASVIGQEKALKKKIKRKEKEQTQKLSPLFSPFSSKMRDALLFAEEHTFSHKIYERKQRRQKLIQETFHQVQGLGHTPFKQKGQKYFFLPMVKAIPKLNFEGLQDFDPTLILDEKVGLVFIKTQEKNHHEAEPRQVVYNPRSQSLGAVTGSLIVNLKDIQEKQILLSELSQWEVLGEFSMINTLILRPPASLSLLEGLEKVKKHPSVEEVRLEILETELSLK